MCVGGVCMCGVCVCVCVSVCVCAHMCISSKSSAEHQGHPYSDTYNFFPTWPSFDSPHESWITGNPRHSSFPEHPFLFLFVHNVFWDVASLGFFLLKYHLLLKSQPKIYLHLVFFFFCFCLFLCLFFIFKYNHSLPPCHYIRFCLGRDTKWRVWLLELSQEQSCELKSSPFLELLKA